ncbi:MAG: prephenate dehydrogenase/arogenate dehydrogenase family protein [Patescibacteria group bacterium]
MEPSFKTIGIIGGNGLIGSFLAGVFKKAGFTVLISDLKTKLTNREVIEKSGIVVFSVPLHLMEKVILESILFTRKDQLLLDVASIKTPAINAMLRSKAQVLGLHPMFRPSPSGLKNQNIVMCPARVKPKLLKIICDVFRKQGAVITKMSAKKHDELMAVVQALTHFRAMVFGNTLRRLKVKIPDTLSVMSPVYRLEFDLMGRIFAQDPHLYAEIQMGNPSGVPALAAMAKETRSLQKIIERQDVRTFLKKFKNTAKYLAKHTDAALEESNKLLTFFRPQ